MRLYKNNAASRTTRALPAVAGSGQSLFVANGAAFPRTRRDSNFFLTLDDEAGHYEILLVTGSPGTAGPAVLVVDRAQQGTSALAWPVDSLVERRVTAQEFREFWSESAALTTLPEGLAVGGDLVAGDAMLSTPLPAISGGTGRDDLSENALIVGSGGRPVGAVSPSADAIAVSPRGEWIASQEDDFASRALNRSRVEGALSASPLPVVAGGLGQVAYSGAPQFLVVSDGVVSAVEMGTVERTATALLRRHVFFTDVVGNHSLPITTNAIGLPAGREAYLFITAAGPGGGGAKLGDYHSDHTPGAFGNSGGDGSIVYGWFGPFTDSDYPITMYVGNPGTAGGGYASALLNGGAASKTEVFLLRVARGGDQSVTLTAEGGQGGQYGSTDSSFAVTSNRSGNTTPDYKAAIHVPPATAGGIHQRAFMKFKQNSIQSAYQVETLRNTLAEGLDLIDPLSATQIAANSEKTDRRKYQSGGGGKGGAGGIGWMTNVEAVPVAPQPGFGGFVLIEVYF